MNARTAAVAARLLPAAIGTLVWFLPAPHDPVARHALAIGAGTITAWMTHAADYAVSGLIGCYLFWALGVAKFPVAFGGFSDSTTWFAFGAILMGAMASKTGLPRRLAYLVLLRCGTTYSRILLGFVIADLLLTLFVPAGLARVMILAPVAAGVVEAFGLGRGSSVGRGLFVVMTYAATIFDKMILGGLAAIAATSAMTQVGHVEVLWSRWALACAPGAILTVLAAWRLALWLFPPEVPALAGGAAALRTTLASLGPWTAAEKRAAALLTLALGLWATDWLHHLSPATVGLGIGLAAAIPGLGLLEADDLRRVNYLPVLFIGSAIGLGNVMAASGVLNDATGAVVRTFGPFVHGTRSGAAVLYGAACAYHLLLGNEIAMVSTTMPAMMTFARASGLDPMAVGLIWTLGSGGKIFLYQSAVLILGHSYGYFSRRDVLRLGLWLTLVEAAVVAALAAWYWPLLGIG